MVALVVAIAVAIGVGLISFRRQDISAQSLPTRSAGPGEDVLVAGFGYRLEQFSVAASLPADDADDPAVSGPNGSVIVLVVFTQTPTAGATLTGHGCRFSLRGADATWEPDSELIDPVRRPERRTCSNLDDDPLRVGRPQQIGVSFVIPAAAAGQLTFRLVIDERDQLLELHR